MNISASQSVREYGSLWAQERHSTGQTRETWLSGTQHTAIPCRPVTEVTGAISADVLMDMVTRRGGQGPQLHADLTAWPWNRARNRGVAPEG